VADGGFGHDAGLIMTSTRTHLLLAALTFTAACGDNGTGSDTGSSEETGGGDTTAGEQPTTTQGVDDSTGAEESTAGEEAGTTGDDTTGGMLDWPIGGCGAPEYALLDTADMGEILDFQLAIELESTTIDTLLTQYNFDAFIPVEFGAKVYKIRYRTQDRGQAVEATGFVAFPTGGPVEARPTVLWAHGTTGFSDMCAPTHASMPEGFGIPAVLAGLGFVTVAPDYLGMNGWGDPSGFVHPYIVPEPTAIASLDSLRAVFRFGADTGEDLPATPASEIVLFGASEGGFATLWTDRIAPFYAPEFSFVANVAAVPPTDAIGLTQHGTSVFGPTTGALAAAIVGGHTWHQVTEPLTDVLADEVAMSLPELMMSTCGIDFPDDVTMTDQVYQQSFIDAIQAEDWDALGVFGCVLKQATLRLSEIPLMVATPTLVVQGEADDLVYTPVVRDDLPKLCEAGYVIDHFECAGKGHTDAVLGSLPYVVGWVYDRLDGLPIAEPCVIHAPVDCDML
jgi:hypothetical protein